MEKHATAANKTCCSPTCSEGENVAAMPRVDDENALREMVKARYGQAITATMKGAKPACCGSSTATAIAGPDPITRGLYDAAQTEGVPEEALLASFGCGNPTAMAELSPGETVLDLGSGGGMDVLLSAMRVGPTGKALVNRLPVGKGGSRHGVRWQIVKAG